LPVSGKNKAGGKQNSFLLFNFQPACFTALKVPGNGDSLINKSELSIDLLKI
jgi:hypothetical protein